MIISASRRTDLPAFYAEWFINRVRAGYCTVPNPFNPAQVSRVSLKPEDVEVIVFWTRHPRPLFPYLDELDGRGYRYYFQYTLMDNPSLLDPHTPSLDVALDTFRQLAGRVGPERVIWRYDPIVFSTLTTIEFHQNRFKYIAQSLRGCTRRAVISIVDEYRKTQKRMRELPRQGVELLACEGETLGALMRSLVQTAQENDMEIVSCAEEIDLRPYGVRPGKCVDDEYIAKTFGLRIASQKDPGQREVCGCVASRDIGMYDTCLFGCRYCYATSSLERARANHRAHDPLAPSLVQEGNLK